MLTTSRRIQIGLLLSLLAAGCGGTSTTIGGSEPDGSLPDDSSTVGEDAMGTPSDDGSTPTGDSGCPACSTQDSGPTADSGPGQDGGGMKDGGGSDGGG